MPKKYTGTGDPCAEKLLKETLPEIAADVSALRLPRLAGVYLGGGYGRGEGGVLRTARGTRLYNDLDFFVLAESASAAELKQMDRALKAVSMKWERKLGIAVDFGPVKNRSRLGAAAHTLMFQELRRGYVTLCGDPDLETYLPELKAEQLPFSEAARLLLNRGMGLLLAGEHLAFGVRDHDFIVRNINKAVLGSADACLLAAGKYQWSLHDRISEFAEFVRERKFPREYIHWHRSACRFKLEPETDLPPHIWQNWLDCRRFWRDAVVQVSGSGRMDPLAVKTGLHRQGKADRSIKNQLRWLIRSWSVGSWRMLYDEPAIRLLAALYELFQASEHCPVCPPRLYKLWKQFN